jgi:nucleoside-diphosphate-sugar epimerase
VVRRLIADPAWEVRVSDRREQPAWMREACETHSGDLRDEDEARAAAEGCSHVIHLAAIVGGIGNFHRYPHTLLEANTALYNGVFRAALDERVERLVYVSSSMVFERATEYPTTEEHIADTPIPESAYGFSKLAGEVYCRALHDEHGLPFTICRPFNAYGPGEMPEDEPLQIFGSGEQTRTLTHIDDIASGVVAAMASPNGENEDFNISASEEMTVAEIARVIWEACGEPASEFQLEHLPTFQVDVQRRWPSVEKARRLLGWEPAVSLEDGLRLTAEWRLTAAP